jgi:hypothetical protein
METPSLLSSPHKHTLQELKHENHMEASAKHPQLKLFSNTLFFMVFFIYFIQALVEFSCRKPVGFQKNKKRFGRDFQFSSLNTCVCNIKDP